MMLVPGWLQMILTGEAARRGLGDIAGMDELIWLALVDLEVSDRVFERLLVVGQFGDDPLTVVADVGGLGRVGAGVVQLAKVGLQRPDACSRPVRGVEVDLNSPGRPTLRTAGERVSWVSRTASGSCSRELVSGVLQDLAHLSVVDRVGAGRRGGQQSHRGLADRLSAQHSVARLSCGGPPR
jgi:hypothetical protein